MRRSTSVGVMVTTALLLSGFGILLIYSASRRVYGIELALKQSLWLAIGLLVFFVILTLTRPQVFRLRWPLYAIGLVLLLVTLQYGTTVRGDRSWLSVFGWFNIQASEPMKPLLILVLAGVAERVQLGTMTRRTGLGLQVLLLAVPVSLILMQPDMGTALVYMGFMVGWLLVQGHWRSSVGLMALGAGIVVGLFTDVLVEVSLAQWLTSIVGSGLVSPESLSGPWVLTVLFALCVGMIGWPYVRGRELALSTAGFVFLVAVVLGYQLTPFLADYQLERLQVYLNPYQAPLTSGYNIIQSQIAIGSGGWLGQGYLNGSQSQLGFIPELWTDFVFSVAVEELGFLLAGLMLSLLFVLIYSTFALATLAPDWHGYLTGAGVALVWILHTVVNLGVCVGLIPVLGLPLPFLSYGGSFLVTNWFMLGVVLVITRPTRGRVVGEDFT